MQFQCSTGPVSLFRLTLGQDIPCSELVNARENQFVVFIVQRGSSNHTLVLPGGGGSITPDSISVVMFIFSGGRLWPVSGEMCI